MGATVRGFLCYGVRLGEEDVMPWDSKKYEGGWIEWYCDKTGKKWMEDELFIGVENYNHDPVDQMFIVCIRKYTIAADMGDPTSIVPYMLTVDENDLMEFMEFMRKHRIYTDSVPQWWLCCEYRGD